MLRSVAGKRSGVVFSLSTFENKTAKQYVLTAIFPALPVTQKNLLQNTDRVKQQHA